MSPKKIHLINTLWGEVYAKDFLEFSLPTIFTSENLPYLCSKFKAIYKIYTDSKTKTIIENHPNFSILSNICNTKIIDIDLLDSLNKYDRMTQYYSIGFQDANKNDAGVITLSPDIILASNALKNLCTYIEQNKRIVFISGLRVGKESFCDDVKSLYQSIKNLEKMFSPRNLVKYIIKHLHPILLKSFWNKKKITIWPSNILWKINDNCLLNCCFHFHPLYMWPKNKRISLTNGTYDTHFPILTCPDVSTWKVVDDSDDILAISFSNKSEGSEEMMAANRFSLANWLVLHNDFCLHNLFLFKHKLFFHACDLKMNQYREIVKESEDLYDYLEKKAQKASGLGVQKKKKITTKKTLYYFCRHLAKFVLLFFPPFLTIGFSKMIKSAVRLVLKRVVPYSVYLKIVYFYNNILFPIKKEKKKEEFIIGKNKLLIILNCLLPKIFMILIFKKIKKKKISF